MQLTIVRSLFAEVASLIHAPTASLRQMSLSKLMSEIGFCRYIIQFTYYNAFITVPVPFKNKNKFVAT